MNCPRCQATESVHQATVPDLDITVYVCRQCEALWLHPDLIGPLTYMDLPVFLNSRGVSGGWSALSDPRPYDGSEDALAHAQREVEGAPEDVPARLRFAGLLLERDRPVEALNEYAAGLSREPANRELLAGAARAAETAGEFGRADGYRQLLAALGGPNEADPEPEPVPSDEERPRPRRLRVVQGGDGKDEDWRTERPTVTLDDVAGMDTVKRRLAVAFLGPMRNPELRRMFGKSLRGGLLLFGPPGCGKTYLARAVAGELDAHFISVGLSDILDMWLGESERKLHEIFATARRHAPTVLFFDEVDALGRKRSHLTHSAGRNVVVQLLAEMDGVDQNNDGVFVLGATNHPWDVDAALLRPGRFDRSILVLPPDEAARAAILRLHLRDRPADTVDVSWIAARTKEFSGADLAHLCETAAENALEASLSSGTPRAMTISDFRTGLAELRPSTRQWFETARNYAMFANEGGIYDELLTYMRGHKLL